MNAYIRVNLGTVLIDKSTWDRAKKIRNYTRDDIKEVIIQNGLDSLVSSIDTYDLCEHGHAASGGICPTCEKEGKV